MQDYFSEKSAPGPRGIPLSAFIPLKKITGISLYSLQKITGTDQIKDSIDQLQITSFDNAEFDTRHGRFMDTAALMMNLDLIITTDTSIAHLAGALGIPVWTILPCESDWRWFLDQSDTPLYPTMRLFRQKNPSDWNHVIQEICIELRQKIDNH